MSVKFTALKWKEYEKNTLRGFFDLEVVLDDLSLIICGATYHEKGNERWVSMPAKPYKDKQTGKDTWANIINWPSREAQNRFLAQALVALDKMLKENAGTPAGEATSDGEPAW